MDCNHSPGLGKKSRSDQMEVPSSERVVDDSVETHHGFIPIGGPKAHAKLVSLTFLRPGTGGPDWVGEESTVIRPEHQLQPLRCCRPMTCTQSPVSGGTNIGSRKPPALNHLLAAGPIYPFQLRDRILSPRFSDVPDRAFKPLLERRWLAIELTVYSALSQCWPPLPLRQNGI